MSCDEVNRVIKIHVKWIKKAFKAPIKALLQTEKRVRAKVLTGGANWTADNNLGLACRWSKRVIVFKEVLKEEDSFTKLKRKLFDLDFDYYSL